MNVGRAMGNLAASVTLTYRAIAGKPLRSHRSGQVTGQFPGQLAMRLCADQKRIWSCSRMLAGGEGWKTALGIVGTTAALIALDPYDTPYLQQTVFQERPAIRALNGILSGRNMALLINAVPLGFFIGGLVGRNSYAWQTGLLAGEAAADAEIIAIAMKHMNRRMRPIAVGPAGDFKRTWFLTKGRNWDGTGCFPSAHTASSFAVATVFAERYRSWRWFAYGVAGIIGASRLNARAHFPSDVFFGGALGYSISHFVVMQRPPETPQLPA